MKHTSGVTIILVDPETQGNIGAISRSMKNTFFENLALAGVKFIDDDAYARAMEGKDILDRATIYNSLKDARSDFDVLVATSSVPSGNMRDYRRIPVGPDEFWHKYYNPELKTAIVMGREGDGLRNSELEICDFFITIPGNPEYPVYNLSHALTLILYEFLKTEDITHREKDPASGEEIGILVDKFMYLARKTNFSAHKMPNTNVMLRRLFSRSELKRSEFYRIMGILRKIDIASKDMNDSEENL